MSLERFLRGQIPFGEAAAFFLKLKTASDQSGSPAVGPQGAPDNQASPAAAPSGGYAPPDTTGVLEGQFAAPVEQVLQLMSEMALNEFKTMYAYRVYSQSLRDLSHASLADEFEEHAEDELEHSEFLLRRMNVLGGPIQLPDIPAPPASTNPVEILQTLIRMEQEGLTHWKALHAMMGDNPSRFKIEEYMTKEQEHLDDLWQFLPQDASSPVLQPTAVSPGASSGMSETAGQPDTAPPANVSPTQKMASALQRVLRRRAYGNFDNHGDATAIMDDFTKSAAAKMKEKLACMGGNFNNVGELSTRLAELAKTANEGPREGIGQAAAAAAGGYAGHRIAKELLGSSGAGTIKERLLRSLARGGAALAGAGAAGAVGKEVGKSLDWSIKDQKKREKTAGMGGSVDWRPMSPMPMTAGDPMATPQSQQALQVSMPVIGDYPGKRPSGGGDAAAAPRPRRAAGGGGDDMGLGGLDFGKEGSDQHEKGKQRAETNVAARAHQTSGMRGELYGDVIGRLLGAGGGHYAGKPGGSLASIAGAALGQHIGGHAGKALGREIDSRRHFAKHAFSDMQNMLAHEQEMEAAQTENEAQFYLERTRASQQAQAQLQSQLQQAQAEAQEQKSQLEQLQAAMQQQQQQANNATTQALMQTVNAQNEALTSRQQANDASNAFQQLKQRIREVIDGNVESPSADGAANPQGPAAQSPSPGQAATSAPAAGDTTTPAPTASPQSGSDSAPSRDSGQKEAMKIASMAATMKQLLAQQGGKLPYALGGAALMSGAQALSNAAGSDDLRNEVEEQEKIPAAQRGFGDALSLAQHKARLAAAEAAEHHPIASTAAAALGGGMLGASAGPALAQKISRVPKDLQVLFGG